MLYQLSYSRRWPHAATPRVAFDEVWWREEDLNLRRLTPADLQSAPFNHSGIPPYKHGCKRTNHGADEGTRTRNLLITNQLLYQLSYVSDSCDRSQTH